MTSSKTKTRTVASPRAKRAAAQAGISLDGIRGTGPGGRIVEADIKQAKTPASSTASTGDPLFQVRDKVIVITGAASGLGRTLAVALARRGARIVLADINQQGVEQTLEIARKLGARGMALSCDLANPQDIEALFQKADETFGEVNVLINNAFTFQRSRPEDLSMNDWERVIRVNLTACFLCAQEAGRRMIAQGKGGSIINISSIAGASALGRGNFVYSISKAGLNQMTRELAVEWARHGIRVNCILPCQVETPPVKAWLNDPKTNAQKLVPRLIQGIPMGRFAQPEDFIGPVVFLASAASAMVTGTLLPVDGGNLALNAGGTHEPEFS